ncbi:hypothetical protein F2Q69_00043266 [Brassica cretica]|uniref:Uncharacterized protein n=1 Tax=Brassica cretica TaxID=69181 RepID=A0A8S9NW38_BRACR|nr:hypothetical protein F2Q69_00043266 [Brassica cretica]
MITRVTVSPVADSLIQVVGITEEGASLEAASSAITFTSPQGRPWAMLGSTFNISPGNNPQATLMMLGSILIVASTDTLFICSFFHGSPLYLMYLSDE